MAEITAMIIAIAVEFQLPPNFVLAVASYKAPIESVEDIRVEWRTDYGAKIHAESLNKLAWQCYRNTWFTVALWYAEGSGLHYARAGNKEIEYAAEVMERYAVLEGGRINPVVGYTDDYGFY